MSSFFFLRLKMGDEKTITCARHTGVVVLAATCLSGSAFFFLWVHWILCVLVPQEFMRAHLPILLRDCASTPYLWFEGVALLFFALAVGLLLAFLVVTYLGSKTLRFV
jgi:hypothetical protein